MEVEDIVELSLIVIMVAISIGIAGHGLQRMSSRVDIDDSGGYADKNSVKYELTASKADYDTSLSYQEAIGLVSVQDYKMPEPNEIVIAVPIKDKYPQEEYDTGLTLTSPRRTMSFASGVDYTGSKYYAYAVITLEGKFREDILRYSQDMDMILKELTYDSSTRFNLETFETGSLAGIDHKTYAIYKAE